MSALVAFSGLILSIQALRIWKSRPPLDKRGVKRAISALEERVQRDEGKRGIGQLIAGPVLQKAAEALCSCKRVVVLTGFPCLLAHPCPQETDGPLGALAIAKALIAMGKNVCLVTDVCSSEVLFECMAASGVLDLAFTSSGAAPSADSDLGSEDATTPVVNRLRIESFPEARMGSVASRAHGIEDTAESTLSTRDLDRLATLRVWADGAVAIERAGCNAQGDYLTMSGKNMNHLVAPLAEMFFMSQEGGAEMGHEALVTVAIGDGGNEVGMGSVDVASSAIPNAKEIACIIPANHLLVSSVSNWGGYALAAALGILHASGDDGGGGLGVDMVGATGGDRRHSIARCVPSAEEETAKMEAILLAGARDGVVGKPALNEEAWSVDGMPFSTSLHVLRELTSIALARY